jgi:hypothetical protein
VIVFDWDDTLLCSSFLRGSSEFQARVSLPAIVKRRLQRVETAAQRLLELAMKPTALMPAGFQCLIVTNAAEGWVEESCEEYLPGLAPLVRRLTVTSASARFGDQFPGDYAQWKLRAFDNIREKLDPSIVTNIVSVGDQDYELDAARVLAGHFDKAFTKTVKCRANPTPEELAIQLENLTKGFKAIVAKARDVSIDLTRKPRDAMAPFLQGSDVHDERP